jgi:hypothetical protein
MIILNESTEKNLVEVALKNFISAASQSEKPYTVDQLQEMVLYEAGGFFSWIKRKLIGVDDNLIAELKDDISKIKTSKDKIDTLMFLDKLIDDTKDIIGEGGVKTGLKVGFGAAYSSSSIINGFKILSGKFDVAVDSIPIEHIEHIDAANNANSVIRKTGATAVVVGSIFLIITIGKIIKTMKANNGDLHSFLDALIQLKTEVEAIKIVK